jgi:hypothetical protein
MLFKGYLEYEGNGINEDTGSENNYNENPPETSKQIKKEETEENNNQKGKKIPENLAENEDS